jgi:putative acetyltransferase
MISSLIPAVKNDLDFFYRLYMHPQVNRYLLYDMMTIDAFEPVYFDLLYQGVLYRYLEDNINTGMCKLVLQKYRNSHTVYLGGVAIDPVMTGRGSGLGMMNTIIQWAAEKNKTRIELSVAAENIRAVNMYKKAGFKEEGLLRKYTWLESTQEYLDEIMMSFIFE